MEDKQSKSDKSSEEVRPQFGNRFLTDPSSVFKHNAWDNVQWDAEQEESARQQVEKNSTVRASADAIENYNKNANLHWNKFYGIHDNKFFKDRHWLFTEFPELIATNSKDLTHTLETEDFPGSHAQTRILEVGCGVGNTIFPIVETNQANGAFVYGCDFSENAIEIVKNHELYKSSSCHAFVCDITQEDFQMPFPENNLDFIILIFVLSAVNPDSMQSAINKLVTFLKPGGKILFRDYGRFDMAQLRFKPGRCISDNFYARGDGTKVYFFTQEDAEKLFENAGLVKEQSLVDRRLQVNRSKLLKMYRVWIQCKYVKKL